MPTKKVTPVSVTVPKKTATKVVTEKRPLVYATEATSFWTKDGQILNSLSALKDALATMPKAEFSHHVTAAKNDFAEWVEQVLLDPACAKDLRAAKTAAAARTVLTKHLQGYHT